MATAAKTRATTTPAQRAERARERAEAAKARLDRQVFRIREAQARKLADMLERENARGVYSGSYAATKRTRIKSGPSSIALAGSSDDHLDPKSHDDLRRIAQDLYRNSPLARAMINRLCQCETGLAGIRPQATTGNPEWNTKAEAWFEDWANNRADVRGMRSFWQLQTVILKSLKRDGDVAVLKNPKGTLQIVEGQRVRSPAKLQAYRNTPTMADGVEMDGVGRPVAFHVREGSGTAVDHRRTVKVPAEHVFWLINPHGDFASATRGEPLLSCCADLFNDIDEMRATTIVAARMATMLALVIYSENPSALQNALLGETVDAEGGPAGAQQHEQTWGPASVLHLKTGEKAEQVKPEQPRQGFEDFVRFIVRQIGSEIGLPLEMAMFDFSQTNFYGNRAAMVMAWLGVQGTQRWFIDRFLAPLWAWRIGLAIEDGELPPNEEFASCKWVPSPMPAIDEEADFKGKGLGMALGLLTRKDAIERGGGDYDETMAQLAREKEKAEELGLTFAMVQGATAATGGSAAEAGKKAEESGEEDPGDGDEP